MSSPRRALATALSVVVHVGLFAAFGACHYWIASRWAITDTSAVAPTCIGAPAAARRIVYLHGLDSHAPSWQELDNRRALASLPDAAIAIPRAPTCRTGRCWTLDNAETASAIRDAARTCFRDDAPYGVIGFSRGGFALANLPHCSTASARWVLLAGAFGHDNAVHLRDCPIAVVIGRGDRYHRPGAIDYARTREAARLPTSLFEFDGGHRLDADTLARALDALEREARRR